MGSWNRPRFPPTSRRRSSSGPAATRCTPRSSCACSTSAPNGAALPETVQGIIAARLDVLTREEKELLQDAAVLGRVFWVGGLGQEREAAEAALHRLERREFVQRERRSTVAGETEYAFRHALVREVAYEQIPGPSEERSTAALPTGSRRSAGPTISPSSSPITTSRCSTTRSRTRARRTRGSTPWARRVIGRSRSTRTQPLQVSTGARSKSAARVSEGTLLFGLGNALAALADAEAVDRLVDASATLLAAGDPETAAEAETILAQIAFTTGDAPGVTTTRAAPSSSCAGVRRSAAQARALGQAARFAMLDGRWTRRDRDRAGSRTDGRRAGPRRDPGRRARDARARRGMTSGSPAAMPTSSWRSSSRKPPTRRLPSRARSTTSHGGTPASTCDGP